MKELDEYVSFVCLSDPNGATVLPDIGRHIGAIGAGVRCHWNIGELKTTTFVAIQTPQLPSKERARRVHSVCAPKFSERWNGARAQAQAYKSYIGPQSL